MRASSRGPAGTRPVAAAFRNPVQSLEGTPAERPFSSHAVVRSLEAGDLCAQATRAGRGVLARLRVGLSGIEVMATSSFAEYVTVRPTAIRRRHQFRQGVRTAGSNICNAVYRRAPQDRKGSPKNSSARSGTGLDALCRRSAQDRWGNWRPTARVAHTGGAPPESATRRLLARARESGTGVSLLSWCRTSVCGARNAPWSVATPGPMTSRD